MALYRYTATDPSTGDRQRGRLSADSAYQVRLTLRKTGLLPRRVDEVATRASAENGPGVRSRLAGFATRLTRSRRKSELVELYENLAALLATGTRIAEALTILGGGSERSGNDASSLCLSMAESIRRGATLADAMADHGEWFGAVDAALIRASEQTGETPEALEALAQHHARSEALRGRLVTALAYPFLLLVFGLGVVVFLSTSTLPQLTGVLVDAEVAVPPLTRGVMAAGTAVKTAPLLALLVAALAIGGPAWVLRCDRLALARLRAPLVGRVLVRSQLAGASDLLARLLDGGLTLSEALALVAPTVPNAKLRGVFADMERDLREGRSASSSLEKATFVEPTYRRVLAVGEEAGELAPTLRSIGARYRASSARLIDRLAAVLEPSVILLLAVLVGLVVFAAILPMLRLTQAL